MLYPTCTMISSVALHITEDLVLKIGYLWIMVQFGVQCQPMAFVDLALHNVSQETRSLA